MKKLILLITAIVFVQLSYAQQLDQKTITIIKVKMMNAEELYQKGEYNDALQKIDEIEKLAKGNKSPKLQNLKVKCYVGKEKYITAQEQLDMLYGMNPSDEILKDIASYTSKIDEKAAVEEIKNARMRRQQAAQLAELKRKETLKEFMGKMTDSRDGKSYKTIVVGSQTWFAENLNYKTGNSCCYDDNSSNCKQYGRMYDWETALNACPTGWHLPSDDEWKILEMYFGMSQSEVSQVSRGTKVGEKMKSITGWEEYGSGTNIRGFNALPGGFDLGDGSFRCLGSAGAWWSSTERSGTDAWIRELGNNVDKVNRGNHNKTMGFSVRCLKD